MTNAEAIALKTFELFDPRDLGPWSEMWHEKASVTPASGWPEPGPFVGRDAIVRQFERLFADWSEYRLEEVEATPEPDDWAIVSWRFWARGGGSGLEVSLDIVAAFRVADDKIVRGHFGWTRDEALGAAGLA